MTPEIESAIERLKREIPDWCCVSVDPKISVHRHAVIPEEWTYIRYTVAAFVGEKLFIASYAETIDEGVESVLRQYDDYHRKTIEGNDGALDRILDELAVS